MPRIHLTAQTCELLSAAFGAMPFTIAEAEALGLRRAQLRSVLDAGRVRRLRRGVLILSEAMAAADEATRHLLLARAGQLAIPAAVASNGTALLAQGLPSALPSERIPELPTLTRPEGGGRRDGLLLVRGELTPADVTRCGPLVTTTVFRTAVDCAGGRPLPEALVVLDAALRREVVALRRSDRGLRADDPAVEVVRGQLSAAASRAARTTLAEPIALASVLSESPAESWSRGVILHAGLPPPVLQHQVCGDDGRWYRTDFAWPRAMVIGEVDGWVKYDRIEAVWAEKARQDALQRAGWKVVRWTWYDIVHRPHMVMAWIQTAVAA